MTAIERIKAHFDSIGTRKIVVPEWGGLEIFYTPYTIAERNRIYKGGDTEDDAVISALIEKAKDAQGAPLFTVADKAALFQKTEAHTLTRLVNEMIAPPKVAELGKS